MESFQAELEELMSHPDGARILELLDRQESAGSGDVADGVLADAVTAAGYTVTGVETK